MRIITLRCIEFKNVPPNGEFYCVSAIGGKHPEKPRSFVKVGENTYRYPDDPGVQEFTYIMNNTHSLVVLKEDFIGESN